MVEYFTSAWIKIVVKSKTHNRLFYPLLLTKSFQISLAVSLRLFILQALLWRVHRGYKIRCPISRVFLLHQIWIIKYSVQYSVKWFGFWPLARRSGPRNSFSSGKKTFLKNFECILVYFVIFLDKFRHVCRIVSNRIKILWRVWTCL